MKGASSFEDVAADMWYADAIAWAAENGIVFGYNEKTFAPNDTVTREQIAAIFYRYAQYKGVNTKASSALKGYTDVDEVSDWAMDAVKWAKATGFMIGRTTTTLNPAEGTMRSELAQFLYRWCTIFAG